MISLLLSACGAGDPLNADRCNVVIAKISPLGAIVLVGDSVQFTATYTAPTDCLPGIPASALYWRSTNAGVASIDSLTGTAVARGAGSTSISAHVPGSETAAADVLLSVKAP